MPELAPDRLHDLGRRVFEAAGAPADVADHVAGHLVASNLAGHDSHGVLRIPWYLGHVRRGWLRPAARPRVVEERPAAALVSGEWGFGHPAATVAIDAAAERARRHGLGAAALVRGTHIGRLGTYVERAAAGGLVAMVWLGGLGAQRAAVPHGASRGIYGTNPMAAAFPAGGGDPLLLDFATTAVAGGKVMVARDKGVPLPEGVVLDRDGRPTTDPAEALDGGWLLPFGAHKGYALAFFAQLLGQALTGADALAGETDEDSPFARAGAFFIAIDPGLFRHASDAAASAAGFAAAVRELPAASGFERVLAPGDPEAHARRERARAISLPEETWRQIAAAAGSVGVAVAAD
ncbi:MAG TPA: Ldh family oxidoreductase [Candidatus Dormibacteraeota bacterium]|nr:Ldh family oxidoreductase [Candidatus Dormibacteraeota bacterium]